MLGNNRMDIDQMNRCVKRYNFLSPRFDPSYSQRTECDLPSSASYNKPSPEKPDQSPTSTTKRSFLRLFSSWKASCETTEHKPTATDRMERAKESLKQMESEQSTMNRMISEMEIQNYLAKETGKDRITQMFTKDHMGQSSPEFKFVYQVTLQSAAATFLVMSTLAGRQARLEFIERNRATVFNTRFQAFRRMQDAVFLFSLKEGAKWALRVSLFSLTFLGISQSIAVYRNKSSVWEYVLAAGTTMGLLKMNMGLRAWAVSTGLGSAAGLVMGFVVLGAMKGLNETQEQRHYWNIHKELERERHYELKGKLPVDDSPAVETA